ncbi:MAG: FAD-binding protein, partial [Prevotella sp.]|nr:FAD-binding protein [Prevotella sp.]
MTYEYQIRVLPQQTANEATLREFISRDKGLDARTINHVRVLKKSIDARHRTIYVNLKV